MKTLFGIKIIDKSNGHVNTLSVAFESKERAQEMCKTYNRFGYVTIVFVITLFK